MEEIIQGLYYIVDDWADQQYGDDEEAKALMDSKHALEEEIAQRIGEGGWEMLENLSELKLKLEDIHDKALFEAAMSLGTKVAQPRRRS